MPATRGVRTLIEPRCRGSVPRNSLKATRMADGCHHFGQRSTRLSAAIVPRQSRVEPGEELVGHELRAARLMMHEVAPRDEEDSCWSAAHCGADYLGGSTQAGLA